jgi:hypothetical protein
LALDEYTQDELQKLDEQIVRLAKRNKSLGALATSQRNKIYELEHEIAKLLDIPAINYELELENRMLKKRLSHAIRELAIPKPKRRELSYEQWLYVLRQLDA